MPALKLSEDLKPLSSLKTQAGEVVRQVEHTGRPVVITRHGKGVAVVLSLESFERFQKLEAHAELLDDLREAERDIKEGRVFSTEEVLERVRLRAKSLGGT